MPESITGVFLGQSRRIGGLRHAGAVAPFPHHSSVVFTTFKGGFCPESVRGFHGLPGALRAVVGELGNEPISQTSYIKFSHSHATLFLLLFVLRPSAR
jgi:hypothetical protein